MGNSSVPLERVFSNTIVGSSGTLGGYHCKRKTTAMPGRMRSDQGCIDKNAYH